MRPGIQYSGMGQGCEIEKKSHRFLSLVVEATITVLIIVDHVWGKQKWETWIKV